MCKAIFPDIVSFLFLFCCMETRKCAFSYNNDNSCNDDDDDDDDHNDNNNNNNNHSNIFL